jgi:hypothetical protein
MATRFPKYVSVIALLPLLITLIGCTNSSSSISSKEVKILQEQKDASDNVTRRAVELIKENRITEVRQLYKNRWNELATLRTSINLDSDLNTAEKQNIEQALRGEQEGITEILAKYERLYGP